MKRRLSIMLSIALALILVFTVSPARLQITGEGRLSLETSIVLAARSGSPPEGSSSPRQIGNDHVSWSGMPERTDPELTSNVDRWELSEDPFGAVIPFTPTSSDRVTFLADGKYLNLHPDKVGSDASGAAIYNPSPSTGTINTENTIVTFGNVFNDVDVNVGVSQAHWTHKVIIPETILNELIEKANYLELVFELETDFNIPEGDITAPTQISSNIWLEVAKAWDDGGKYIPVTLTFWTQGGKRYITKSIPVDWLQTAIFPIYTDVDITWGSAVQFTTANTAVARKIGGDYVDTDLFALGFGEGDAGYAIVGDSSGATVSFGTKSAFVVDLSVAAASLGLGALGTAKIMALYANDAANDNTFVRAVALTGTPATTIGSWGTEVEIATDSDIAMGACGLTTDVAGVVFNWEGGADDMWHHIITASGTALTSEDSAETSSTLMYSMWAKKLDATHFIVIGSWALAGVFAQVIEWNGSTMTSGAVKEVFSTSEVRPLKDAIAVLAEDKVVIFVVSDKADRSLAAEGIWAKACTINLSTHVITTGTGYLIDEMPAVGYAVAYSNLDSCRAGDDDHFVTVYRDEDDSDKGKSRYCSVDWTDTPNLPITVGSAETMNDAATGSGMEFPYICVIDMGTYCVCAYRDDGDINDIGESRKGTYPVAACSEDISNTPDSKDFGAVTESSTYYAYGSAPSNPVLDSECTFTVTNNSGGAVDITVEATNFTGGVGWTLTSGSPGENTVRLTTYYSGQDPAGGVVVTTSPQAFIGSLADSATKKWDFKLETGTFTDGVQKISTLTLAATCQ